MTENTPDSKPTDPLETWAESLEGALANHCKHAGPITDEQRAIIERIEQQLTTDLESLSEVMDKEPIDPKSQAVPPAEEAASLEPLVSGEQDIDCHEQIPPHHKEIQQEQERYEASILEAQHREKDLQEELAQCKNEAAVLKIALDQSRDDLEKMRHQLTESCQQSSAPQEGVLDVQQKDLRRRFEMAVEDIRDLKAKNAELESKLEESASGAQAPDTSGGTLDWEAQKKKMLAQLANEYDDDDEEEREEKLSIEGTIRITDQIISDRDQEISQLTKDLKEASSMQPNNEAVGANAIAALLDQDDLIAQERESLQRIQIEWKEKLRKSEVEISVERAKLARERAMLEESIHALQQKGGEDPGEKNINRGKAKSSGRWLARLGLVNDDEEG